MPKSTFVKKQMYLRPDTKGRITLGKIAKGVSRFLISEREEGGYILEPLAEVPAREKWLFENREAGESVRRGLDQSAKKRTTYRGSFSKYINKKDE